MSDTPVQSVTERKPVELTYVPTPRTLRQRLTSSARFWARNTFSRESLVSSLKSLAWVAPLTVLIWMYAFREQVVVLPDIAINIDPHSNDPTRVVRLRSPDGGLIHADLKGPQAQIDQVKDWLESNSIPIDVDHNLSPGEHQISIVAELNKLPRVMSKGVTVTNCIPEEVRILVDPVQSVDVEVKARPDDVKRLDGPPIFTPSKVKITGPRSVIKAATDAAANQGQQLVAYATLGQQLTDTGKHDISSVAIFPSIRISDPHVTVFPTTVSATIDVKKAEKTYTLPFVRVLAAYPQTVQADQYKAVYNATISVTVSGPEQQIALLQEQKFIPAATFEVKFDNVDSPSPAPVMYQLPPGVHVSDQDSQRMITYTLKPRGTEPGP